MLQEDYLGSITEEMRLKVASALEASTEPVETAEQQSKMEEKGPLDASSPEVWSFRF